MNSYQLPASLFNMSSNSGPSKAVFPFLHILHLWERNIQKINGNTSPLRRTLTLRVLHRCLVRQTSQLYGQMPLTILDVEPKGAVKHGADGAEWKRETTVPANLVPWPGQAAWPWFRPIRWKKHDESLITCRSSSTPRPLFVSSPHCGVIE